MRKASEIVLDTTGYFSVFLICVADVFNNDISKAAGVLGTFLFTLCLIYVILFRKPPQSRRRSVD